MSLQPGGSREFLIRPDSLLVGHCLDQSWACLEPWGPVDGVQDGVQDGAGFVHQEGFPWRGLPSVVARKIDREHPSSHGRDGRNLSASAGR